MVKILNVREVETEKNEKKKQSSKGHGGSHSQQIGQRKKWVKRNFASLILDIDLFVSL